MQIPKQIIERIEKGPDLPEGPDERFSGYGVMGATFSSGHVLALRRFPASSVGPAFTSVWHRNPAGQWNMYQTVAPEQACSRYFSAALTQIHQKEIQLQWTGENRLIVSIDDGAVLYWEISLSLTPATRLMNQVSKAIPVTLWKNRRFLGLMARAAGALLQAGKLRMAGQVPNGQTFVANPRVLWKIDTQLIRLYGEDLGTDAPLKEQARLGQFWIPQQGIFAIGQAYMETFDAARHQRPSPHQVAA